jgi:hypothetical protein
LGRRLRLSRNLNPIQPFIVPIEFTAAKGVAECILLTLLRATLERFTAAWARDTTQSK